MDGHTSTETIARHVVAATESRAAALLMKSLEEVPGARLTVEQFSAHESRENCPRPVTAALVEIGSDAIRASSRLRAVADAFPEARPIAFLPCGELLDYWHIAALLRRDLAAILDLRADPEWIVSAILDVVSGAVVVRLLADHQHRVHFSVRLPDDSPAALPREISPADALLLRLAAQGMPEDQIGRRMNLSAHTIHHKLERLRYALDLRNRIELAAWSGRHGLYGPVVRAGLEYYPSGTDDDNTYPGDRGAPLA